jgi:predicted esterase
MKRATGLVTIGLLFAVGLFWVGCEAAKIATPSSTAQPTGTPAPNLTVASSSATAELLAYRFPVAIDPAQNYLFYLHGKIIEDQGLPAISPAYEEYEYAAILEKLASYGFTVISEQRPKNADGIKYAERVAGQVTGLLKAGVPAGNITIVGASKGAAIAIHVSHLLKNEAVNFVLLGACPPDEVDWLVQNNIFLAGNILAIYDFADEYAGSCEKLFGLSAGKGLARQREIILQIGTGHGILYKPLEDWLIPVIEWTREGMKP